MAALIVCTNNICSVATPTTTLPPQIPVDAALAVVAVNATWARLMWRKFSEFELQFIDGVQLRYKEKDGKVKQHNSVPFSAAQPNKVSTHLAQVPDS
jgi:hypothetical protein